MLIKQHIDDLIYRILDIVSKKIRFNLFHTISYILSKFYPNNVIDNLLVFGSTNGNAFSGNTKTLFEYMHKNPKYKCIWITRSDEIKKNLEKYNYNVVSSKNIFKTLRVLKSAHYIFITHGYGDILLIDFSPNSKLIFLAHGISFKRGGDDMNENFFQRKIREKINTDISFFIDSSDNNVKYKVSAYNIHPNKFIITGYPRNDILVNISDVLKQRIIENLNLNPDYEFILYAPTFREYDYKDPFNIEFLEKLDSFLIQNNKVLLYKPHPFRKRIDLSNYSNIISIDPNIDISDLLIISDFLITDYSSVYIDYLLRNRPIIFFAYDLNDFKKVRDFYYNYEDFVPGPIAKKGDELLEILRNINNIDEKYAEKRKKITKLFHKYTDGKSSERIIEFLNLN
ncbi:MAG: CDP-glycerol glycerophosphotransferase family protein [Promethearchaeota archaeon]